MLGMTTNEELDPILPFDVIKQIIFKATFLDLLAMRVTCTNYYKLIDEDMIITHPYPWSLDRKWTIPTIILIKADYQRRDQDIGVCNIDQQRIARKMVWLGNDRLYLLRPEGTLYVLYANKRRGGWRTDIVQKQVLDIVINRYREDYYSLTCDHLVYWSKILLPITNPVIQISHMPLEPDYCIALDVEGKLWCCNRGEVSILPTYNREEVIFTKLFHGIMIDTTGFIWYVIRDTIYRYNLPPLK